MSSVTEYSKAYLDGCPESRNAKFQEDALDAFLTYGAKIDASDFFQFMRERDWYCNGTFQMRCERNGLVFAKEGNQCVVSM